MIVKRITTALLIAVILLGFLFIDYALLTKGLGYLANEAFGNWATSDSKVINGMVFYGTENGHLCALDARNGKPLWKQKISSTPGDMSTGLSLGDMGANAIDMPPAYSNGTIYISSPSSQLAALNPRTGKKLWQITTDLPTENVPVINGNTVFASGNGIIAYDIHGKKKWSFPRFKKNQNQEYTYFSRPAYLNGKLYSIDDSDTIYAIDASTGRKLWEKPTSNLYLYRPVVAVNTLFATDPDGSLYAFNPKDGKRKWNYYSGSRGDDVTIPIISNGVAYICTTSKQGLHAVNISDGSFRWKFQAGYEGILSTPAISNGVLFIGTMNGNLYALNAATGEKKWRFKAGSPIASEISCDGQTVYFRVDGEEDLYAVDAKTGKLKWKKQSSSQKFPG